MRVNPIGAAVLAACALPASAGAVCCPVFPPGEFLQSSGQLNLVVRESGTIRLVPNIRFSGDADDFALIVPTPGLPQLAPVVGDLWDEAAQLTRPQTRQTTDGLSCASTRTQFAVSADTGAGGGVIVHSQQTVGAFDATIVSSTDPTALTTWLTDNGYLPDASQTAAFAPLVADGWYFTAMKLRPGTPVPQGGWNTSVDPVEFTYDADEFDLPLDVLAINVAQFLTMTVYAVDDHRVDLPGFDTVYANRLSAGEVRAIAERYPTLAGYLASGRMITRLDRQFSPAQLSGRIRLARAATDDEFRRIAQSPVPGDLLLLATPFAWFTLARRRREGGRGARGAA